MNDTITTVAEALNRMKLAQKAFQQMPSATRYAVLEKTMLDYQQAFMAAKELHEA